MTTGSTRTLKARIDAGERLLGALLRLPNAFLTELTGLHGFDFVIFDCEHGPADISVILEHLLISRAAGIPALIRLPGTDSDAILRVLDAGAVGLLVPRIATADDIRQTVAAASYPPRGSRGFATYTPAARYGLTPAAQHLQTAADELVIIAMIEDGVGIDNAAAIAGESGVAATLVGPADLSVNLGHSGDVSHPEVVRSMGFVHEATRQAGAAVMVITGRPAAAAAAYAGGAQLVLINAAATINDAFAGLIGVRDAAG